MPYRQLRDDKEMYANKPEMVSEVQEELPKGLMARLKKED